MSIALGIVEKDGRITGRRFAPESLVIAGWAGRNRAAIDEHIRELRAIGVAPPSSVPLFYRAAASTVTTEGSIQALGPDSSGEVETVLIQVGDERLVAVGSDHTDRKVESYSIAVSKQMCAKPVSPQVWRHSDVAEHWDRMVLRSWAIIGGERVLYQQGRLDDLLPPEDLIRRYSGSDRLPPGTTMFGGTIAVIGGIRAMRRFELELEDPVLGRALRHAYDVQSLPVVS